MTRFTKEDLAELEELRENFPVLEKIASMLDDIVEKTGTTAAEIRTVLNRSRAARLRAIDAVSDKGSTDGGSGQSPTLREIPVGTHRWHEGGAIVLAADDCRVCLGSGDTDPSDAGRGACPACDGTGKRQHT